MKNLHKLVILRIFNIMYILLILLTINATITVINSTPCDKGWIEYDGKCLKYYDTPITWDAAKGTCDMLREALLASVDSPEINMIVHNLTRPGNVWIGLNTPEISISNWKWSDGGNTSSYDDWNVADVNSACAVMNSKGSWYTISCTSERYFICEKETTDGNCSDWRSFDKHCYLITTEHTENNMAAARYCWQYDAYLVSINSELEAEFIYSNITIETEYWIGLSPLKWVDGAPYQWNNWGDNGPTHNTSNGCVYINATSGKWLHRNCRNAFFTNQHLSYICQKAIEFPITPNAPVEVDTFNYTAPRESYTPEFDVLSMSTISSLPDNSEQLMLTVLIPAVCGGLVVIIVIIVVVIVVRRRTRSNGSKKEIPSRTKTPFDIKSTALCGNDDVENYIYDEAEIVQTEKGTIVVNGDVYAIVDKTTVQNSKVQAQISPNSNQKQEIAQGQNHIIVGADVYAIVSKNSAKLDKQHKPNQKKKKPPTPPKLDNNSGEINSNGLSHVVVGTDVYAVVDKEKVKPNTQQTTQQKKKKPPTPPKLEDKTEDINTNGQSHMVVGTDVYAVVDKEKVKPNKHQKPQQRKKKPPAPPKLVEKADVMHEGNVYYESDINGIPATPTKHKTEVKKKTEDTGVVYADLDLTGSGTSNRQAGNHDEESGVVYADVRG